MPTQKILQAPLSTVLPDDALAVITLNVGDGDAIIIRFPKIDGTCACAVVDCYNAKKTIDALDQLGATSIPFVCATHPHYDHTKGLQKLIEWAVGEGIPIGQFWDSGFRHVSKTHYDLLQCLRANPEINVLRPTSGFETVINKTRVLVLNPSIYLKNRYDTYGTNINNASIVLKLEYPPVDIAPYYLSEADLPDSDLKTLEDVKQNSIILGADAQFDAWARITQEFPELVRTENRSQMIDYDTKHHRPLRCQVFKVPHHFSKHGLTLEVVEKLNPRFSIASCSGGSRHGFPHELAVLAVEAIHKKKNDKGIRYTGHRDETLASGSVAAIFTGDGRRPRIYGLGDSVKEMPIIAPQTTLHPNNNHR